MASATWLMTDGLPSGWALAPVASASAVIPPKSEIASAPMISRVVAAFLLLGFWKAGTPLLMASTPVSAVQPEANARKASSTVKMPPTCAVCSSGSVALSAAGMPPVSAR